MSSLVSIIVPCYNQAQYLDECLQSVLEQTYPHWECIIVNDGSPDDTKVVAQEWLDKDSRFRYLQTINKGVSNARNIGIEKANGVFILPLDADDRIGQKYLELSMDAFENNTQLKLVYARAEKFGDEFGEWILEPFTLEKLLMKNMIYSSSIFKKSDWEIVKGYDINMVSGLEDWEFWIALLKNGGDVFLLDEVLFYYRVKKSSRQSDLKPEEQYYLYDYISIKHADCFVKYFGSFKKIYLENRNLKKQLKSKKIITKLFFTQVLRFKLFQ